MAQGKNRKGKKKDQKAKVHKDLKGLDVRINEFGEVESNIDISKLNQFLNRKFSDKEEEEKKGEKEQGEQDEKKDDDENQKDDDNSRAKED